MGSVMQVRILQRGILLCVAFALFAAGAAAEIIFDDWVKDGMPFTADGDEIRVSFRKQNEMGTIFTASSTFIITRGDCKTQDLRQYCLVDVDYERAVFEDDKEYPMIHVRIESLEPTITVEQSYSTTAPQQFERIEAEATLQNTGELRSDNVRLEVSLPVHVRVVSSAGTLVGNTIIFETSLVPGQSKTFLYTIEARDLIDFTITPKVSYSFFDRQKTAYGGPQEIKVKLPFLFDEELSDDGLKVGETLTYNITIRNTAKRGNVDISPLTITIPSGLSVVSAEGVTKDGRTYTFSDSLRKDEEHFIAMVLHADALGDYTISMDAAVAAEGSTMHKTSKQDIKVMSSDITPYLEITPANVRSDAEFTIAADLKNKKPETIRDVIATISFDPPLVDAMRYVGIDLRGRQRASIVRKEMTVPQVDDPTNVTVTLSGMYTDEGKTFRFETKGTIIVEPFPRSLFVSHSFTTTPVQGGNVTLVTRVKNIGNTSLSGVSILDSIKGIKVVDGNPYFDGELRSGAETAFSYVIYVPENYGGDILEITTFMNAHVGEEFFKMKTAESLAFDAKPVDVPLPTATSSEESLTSSEEIRPVEATEAEPQERTEAEEKKGFFVRLFAWISNLF